MSKRRKPTQPDKIAELPWFSKAYPEILRIAEEVKVIVKRQQRFNLNHEVLHQLSLGAEQVLSYGNVAELADRFNAVFVKHGWVALDSFGAPFMQRCLKCHDEDGLNAAEEEIMSFFFYWNIHVLAIGRCRYHGNWDMRADQLKEALELTFEERYVSAVPLILIACDGFAFDFLGRSLFKQNADLSLLDSFVGHKTALPELIRLLTKHVRESSEDATDLPLRHGILHGLTLNYANKSVCMKAWLLFIALTDLYIQKDQQREFDKKFTHPVTFEVSLEGVIEYILEEGQLLSHDHPYRKAR